MPAAKPGSRPRPIKIPRRYKIALALVLVGIVAGGVVVHERRAQSQAPTRIPFSTFMRAIEAEPTKFVPHTLVIEMTSPTEAELTGLWNRPPAAYVTTGYITAATLEKLSAAEVGFELVKEDRGWWLLLSVLVPLLALMVLVPVLYRSNRRPSLATFGKSNAKAVSSSQRKVTFGDVAGIEEAREEVEEIIAFLTDPKKLTRLGGRLPKGVLMIGPPGSGKTLLARAIAGEADVPFFSISGSAFVEMFVGVGASRVRDLFAEAVRSAPCIVFIDEIDAVGRQRGTGLGGGHDEREQTLNQLLVEMDGFAPTLGVIVIAATNRADVLDPALLRPGRFDRQIIVHLPDVRGRRGILDVHSRKTPLAGDVDLGTIARGTVGFSGADLASLVNEAALLAARGDKPALDMHDLEMARDKVLMGPERRSMVVSDRDKRVIAFHEAGHALVGKRMKGTDPIHKVTIIPRGNAIGLTQQLPIADRLSVSREAANDRIALAMGGRVAERIIFGQVTSGAVDDLRTATRIAGRMVCEWGMSERLGPIRLGRGDQAVFLGRDFGGGREYSEQTAGAIDQEVRRIVVENEARAERIVLAELDGLRAIAEALLERETLTGAEIDRLLAGSTLAGSGASAERPDNGLAAFPTKAAESS
jgi:cell division protease FtsH